MKREREEGRCSYYSVCAEEAVSEDSDTKDAEC